MAQGGSWIDDSLNVVGRDREKHPAEVVEAAEHKLRAFYHLSLSDDVSRINWAGAMAAVVGMFFLLNAVTIVAFISAGDGMYYSLFTRSYREFGVCERNERLVQACGGLALFLIGVLLRLRRESARAAFAGLVRVLIFVSLLVPIVWIATLHMAALLESELVACTWTLSVPILLISGMVFLALRRTLRFAESGEVIAVCRGTFDVARATRKSLISAATFFLLGLLVIGAIALPYCATCCRTARELLSP